MATAWYRALWEDGHDFGQHVRTLPTLLALSQEIEAAGGYWAETDVGAWAIVKVRAPHHYLAKLDRELERLDSPQAYWSPVATIAGRQVPTLSLDALDSLVWDDARWDEMRARADALCAAADTQGYVRISDPWGPDVASLLAIVGRRGYGLDRISTGTFPTTPILDTFTGADGTSPPGDNWTNNVAGTGNGLKIMGNRCVGAATGWTYDNAYWHAANFGPDCEVYCDIAKLDVNDDVVTVRARIQDEGSSAVDLYQFHARSRATETDPWRFYVCVNNTFTQIGTDILQEVGTDEKIGLEIIGTTLTGYRWVSGAWTVMGTRTHTAISGAGKLGLELRKDSAADNFGGGTYSPLLASSSVRPTITGMRW